MYVFGSGQGGRCWGRLGDMIGFGLYQFWRNMGKREYVSFGCGGVDGVGGEWVGCMGQGLGGWGIVMVV